MGLISGFMKNYRIKHIGVLLLISISFFSCSTLKKKNEKAEGKAIGTLEVVAEMDINPGNLAVSKEGRVFTTIHPLRPTNVQLVEIIDLNTYVPFPSKQAQSTLDNKTDAQLDAPLGIIFDNLNRLWVLDLGFGLDQTRLFAYDIDTREELLRFDIPKELAPGDSFVQDLAVDETNGFVYLADATNYGIIVVDIKRNEFRKIIHAPSMQSEDVDLVIDGEVKNWMGKPARIALNPLTISADRETLYYGPMNGTTWYQMPTKNIRNGATDDEIINLISVVGKKPLSDGAATDKNGNHYFTSIQTYSIDVLSNTGELSVFKADPLMDWPDNVRIQGDWLYITANQIHKSPAFTGGAELSTPPYRILRLRFR